jgi:hypothetical protein
LVESSKIGRIRQKLVEIAENWSKSPKIGQNRQKLVKIAKNWSTSPKIVKIGKYWPKSPKIVIIVLAPDGPALGEVRAYVLQQVVCRNVVLRKTANSM